ASAVLHSSVFYFALRLQLRLFLFTNYDGSWEERTDGKSIAIQQACALAWRELQKSFGFIMDMQRFNDEHIDMQNRIVEQTPNNVAIESNPQPLDSAEDSVLNCLLFESDAPIECKPKEIKKEPIDECVDIKQEEPFADISTGGSGQIDSVNPKSDRKRLRSNRVTRKSVFAVDKSSRDDNWIWTDSRKWCT
ncbi:hypothetical protein PMAYCL1PPCAC_24918, partial [Pristionchus mayeri]